MSTYCDKGANKSLWRGSDSKNKRWEFIRIVTEVKNNLLAGLIEKNPKILS